MNTKLRLATVLAAGAGAVTLLAAPAAASVEGPTWNHAPHSFGDVAVEDHTGNLWPVVTATDTWGSGYHYGHCRSSQCVRVYESDNGANGVVGTTTYGSYESSSGERFSNVVIHMNDYYGRRITPTQRLEAITHELGHGLGLDHDDGAGRGVMYFTIDGYHTRTSPLERTELRNLYLR
jgi:hypothetical protein